MCFVRWTNINARESRTDKPRIRWAANGAIVMAMNISRDTQLSYGYDDDYDDDDDGNAAR